MLLVLCSREDREAHEFARRFAHRDVYAITLQDISRAGWTLQVAQAARSASPQVSLQATIGGKRVTAREIRGVITRLSFVGERDLKHIVPADRSYVAAEMHAFLFAFLEALPCPVVNRPSLACLYGPHFRAMQWRRYARQAGMPVDEDHPRISENSSSYSAHPEITVLGRHTFGDAPSQLHAWSRELARITGIEYLLVRYTSLGDDARFAGADVFPRLASEEMQVALVEYCNRERLAL